ncbi:MAG: hypothetical protein Q8S29_15110 [Phreatobacter sp.]|nr:hypothetical protein [Phreatobacter sp.]
MAMILAIILPTSGSTEETMSPRARRLFCLMLAVLLGLSGPAFWRGAGSSHAAAIATSDNDHGHGHPHSHDHDGESGQHIPHGPDHSHVTLGLAQSPYYTFGPVRVALQPTLHASPRLDVTWPLERPPRSGAPF